VLCAERQRLLHAYCDAARAYYEAVRDLASNAGFAIGADFEHLRRGCRRQWEQLENARVTLARHEANHYCDRPDFAQFETQDR
jgi:hypothetical protein